MKNRFERTVLVATWELFDNCRSYCDVFEIPGCFRPIPPVDQGSYSSRWVRSDEALREFTRDLSVDLATWLHRNGAWEVAEVPMSEH